MYDVNILPQLLELVS